MANILLSTFIGMLTSASGKPKVSTYCMVGDFVQHRARLTLRVLLFATEKCAEVSTSVSKLLASYWQGYASWMAPTPPPPLTVKGNDAEVRSAARDTAGTEDTASVSSSSNSGGGGGGGARTVQDVFLAARKKRSRKNKPVYNLVDRVLKQKGMKYRVVATCNSGNTAVRAVFSTSAKPALLETSAVSGNAHAADRNTLECLRTGPPTCQKKEEKESTCRSLLECTKRLGAIRFYDTAPSEGPWWCWKKAASSRAHQSSAQDSGRLMSA